jgi:hypothetical protein
MKPERWERIESIFHKALERKLLGPVTLQHLKCATLRCGITSAMKMVSFTPRSSRLYRREFPALISEDKLQR